VSRSFEEILGDAQKTSGARYSKDEVEGLSLYYRLVLKWNERLNLTTLTVPEIFYQRHVLESEFASGLIRAGTTSLWDLGTGLGIPGIPIAVLRPGMAINLVESNRSKVIFLEEAVSILGLNNASVICERLENLNRLPEGSCLTTRAIERMVQLIPEIFRIGSLSSQFLIYGAEEMRPALVKSATQNLQVSQHLIPGSEKRFLFEIV
jgi:16S rRNA (guanine527-N7)-methyltransferase